MTSLLFVIIEATFRMPQANSESRRFHAALDRTLRPLRVAKALHRNPTPLRSLTRHHAHCHIGFRWSQADCPILMRFAADRELLGVSCAVSHARSGHEALRSSPLPERLAGPKKDPTSQHKLFTLTIPGVAFHQVQALRSEHRSPRRLQRLS